MNYHRILSKLKREKCVKRRFFFKQEDLAALNNWEIHVQRRITSLYPPYP